MPRFPRPRLPLMLAEADCPDDYFVAPAVREVLLAPLELLLVALASTILFSLLLITVYE